MHLHIVEGGLPDQRVELGQRRFSLFQFGEERAHLHPLGGAEGNLGADILLLRLERVIPSHILFVLAVDLLEGTALLAALLEQGVDESGQLPTLPVDGVQPRLIGGSVGDGVQAEGVVFRDLRFPGQQAVERRHKALLDVLLLEGGSGAVASLLEFVIAVPVDFGVLAPGVPDLSAIESAAVSADDPAGKRSLALGVATRRLTPVELLLHHLEHLRADDGGMIILDVVLGVLTLIFLRFLGQKIHCKPFLRYDPITDTIQFSLRVRSQGGSNFLGRVQRAKIRCIWDFSSAFKAKVYL